MCCVALRYVAWRPPERFDSIRVESSVYSLRLCTVLYTCGRTPPPTRRTKTLERRGPTRLELSRVESSRVEALLCAALGSARVQWVNGSMNGTRLSRAELS